MRYLFLAALTVILLSSAAPVSSMPQLYLSLSASVDSVYVEPGDYPAVFDVFLMCVNDDDSLSIGGWEAGIITDSELYLAPIELNGINVGSNVNYEVGLENPVEGGSSVLARFSLVAMGPGSIYLRSIESPSIQNTGNPVYSDVDGCLSLFGYKYGSFIDPVLSVGGEVPNYSNDGTLIYNSPYDEYVIAEGGVFAVEREQGSGVGSCRTSGRHV